MIRVGRVGLYLGLKYSLCETSSAVAIDQAPLLTFKLSNPCHRSCRHDDALEPYSAAARCIHVCERARTLPHGTRL